MALTQVAGGMIASGVTLTSPTITGGALNGTLGATTPSTAVATTVTASGLVRTSASGFQSGNTTDSYAKFVYDGGNAALDITNEYNSGGAGSTYGQIVFKNYNSSGGSLTERMRLSGSGNLLLGTTSNASSSKLKIYSTGNNIDSERETTGAAGHFSFVNPNGSVGSIQTSGSSTLYNTSSDYRLKKDFAPMTGALAKVILLKPCTYKWKVDGSDGQGFIAHELAEVAPQCVSGEKDAVDKDGNPIHQGIDTSFLVATLTCAIQELKALNDTQAATITALTARIVALEGN
jgi:hypothetical protein